MIYFDGYIMWNLKLAKIIALNDVARWLWLFDSTACLVGVKLGCAAEGQRVNQHLFVLGFLDNYMWAITSKPAQRTQHIRMLSAVYSA